MDTERERTRAMKIRVYPSCCTLMYCGKIECPDTCKNLPVLQEFKAWKERTKALRKDPIWCPSVWTATKT